VLRWNYHLEREHEMTTYWHVADESYRAGMPLVSRDRQDHLGIETPRKWGDDAGEGSGSHVACLFPDTPDGREQAGWLWYEHPASVLLRAEIDEDCYNMTSVEEGYPAAESEIRARDITVVRRGYADGVISKASA
jgi:hypothetical protein